MITYKFRGVRSGGGAEPPGPAWRGSFNITYACISLPRGATRTFARGGNILFCKGQGGG